MTIRDGSLHDSNEIPKTAASGNRNSGVKLQIGIVGAGIGGLMAAVALLESGHDVESIYFTDPSDLGQKRVVPCADFTPKYGAPFCFFHRVDLHSELRRLATEPTDKRLRTARLHLCTSVAGVDDDGTLWFQDGTRVRKDLVVAADGIRVRCFSSLSLSLASLQTRVVVIARFITDAPRRSQSAFVSRVVEEAPRAQHHMSIMRYLVPSETVMADPEVAGFFVDGLKSLRVVDNVDKRVIIYGCRGYVMPFAPPLPWCDTGQQRTKLPASRGSLQNIGLIYPPQLGMDAAGNDISESEGFASKVMAEFPQTIQSICREAKGVGQWQLFTRTPLERLARGRVVLIGDAAHPMPPLRAQGASMAIEDAAALGVLLSQVGSADEVPARMDMFNKLRWGRVAATQLLSSEHRWDPSRLSEEQRGYFGGDVPRESFLRPVSNVCRGPADLVFSSSPDTEDDVEKYSYGYDVIRDALKLLKDGR
ncbi:Putative FAD-binding domain, FAD/NAD(P)-binding domain superfamily [Colletotrichum destructivum]|uniref:FAD-binding domain, FAD/NAD(P)-binding domain superfamily n=1 Tax=Colletotrichum destructivum TaxID=34406 RepID=A0AAX4IY88_9PEZI|nr:Putative FAD-binding domain, FAD/NAD(P)-binding domain superfamily [Colletotrichum destructivum]